MSGTFEFSKKLGIMACQTLLKDIRIWATMLVASGVLVSCTLDEPNLQESQELSYSPKIRRGKSGGKL